MRRKFIPPLMENYDDIILVFYGPVGKDTLKFDQKLILGMKKNRRLKMNMKKKKLKITMIRIRRQMIKTPT